MTTENQNSSPEVGTPQPMPQRTPPAIFTPPQNQITLELYKFFNEAAKLTVFAIFVLYSIGFIIWHSYLGTYGVSSIAFLQTEYLSAAFCYLFLAISFSIPPALLLERLFLRLGKRENPDSEKVSFLIFFWYILCVRLVGLFFPDPNPSLIPDKYFKYGSIAMIIYIITLVSCKKKWGNKKIYEKLASFDALSIFLAGYVILFLFLNHEVSRLFLLSNLFLYVITLFFAGKDIRKVWKNAELLLKILIFSFLSLILIGNVQLFGNSQFGKIPKRVGGGKPETAFIMISKEHQEVVAFLNIPDSIQEYSNGVMGPIDIIIRSDKDIIFIKHAKPDAVENQTNHVVSTETNLQKVAPINLSTGKVSDITKNIRTNVVEATTTNISEGISTVYAKQIRADLVDGIIFVK